jgi:hypothetical protein
MTQVGDLCPKFGKNNIQKKLQETEKLPRKLQIREVIGLIT